MAAQEIVITGAGVASPIGIEIEEFWASLCSGRSGVRRLGLYEREDLPPPLGGVVERFEPARYVRPRKSLKVMSRDIQLAFAAAHLACAQAGLEERKVDPERLGIVFGAEMIACDLSEIVNVFRCCIVDGQFDFDLWGETAMNEMYPLWMLKYLPNMLACHIGIAEDAQGPNNTLTVGDISSLSAVAEAIRVIERGTADVMIAGGGGSRINPTFWARYRVFGMSERRDDPSRACRPFDADRDGLVGGEGAGAFVLEKRCHAEARGATVLARIAGFASTFEPVRNGQRMQGRSIRHAITTALAAAGVSPSEVGHVNAHGASTIDDDRIEAAAIRDTLGDVPVTAPKSYFGNLGAGSGAVEMAVSVLAMRRGLVPATLNYEMPDPACPINVIHGGPTAIAPSPALVLNHSPFGQAMAVVVCPP
jgi:3-oxoacyl-[acyl-carrier-protein] synthase II